MNVLNLKVSVAADLHGGPYKCGSCVINFVIILIDDECFEFVLQITFP